jgi:Transglutaminase-like superfamily
MWKSDGGKILGLPARDTTQVESSQVTHLLQVHHLGAVAPGANSIAWGSAAKVHDIKFGVCRHYAVLFTCLSRAVGVSSRELAGVAYMGLFLGNHTSKEFAPHMWNEVLLDGCWVRGFQPQLNRAWRYPHRLGARDGSGVSFPIMGKQTLQLIEVERAK